MISLFKKTSFRFSAVSLIVLIAFGGTMLLNSKTNTTLTSDENQLNEKANTAQIAPMEEKILSLKIDLPYSIRKYMSLVIRNKDIEKQYGKPDLIHKMETKTYEIRNISDGSKLFTIYDNISGALIDMWQLKKLFSYENFKNIYEKESSSEDILKIDQYTTIIECTNDTAISEHRLVNNEVINIDYVKKNGLWIVDKIKHVKSDPSNFTNILTPEDLKLIS